MNWIKKLIQVEPVASPEFTKKIDRYSVDEKEIEDLIFETSIKQLCFLTDRVVQEFYPSTGGQEEVDKALAIAAWGVSHKYLTQKQKMFLAGFIIYYSKGELTK